MICYKVKNNNNSVVIICRTTINNIGDIYLPSLGILLCTASVISDIYITNMRYALLSICLIVSDDVYMFLVLFVVSKIPESSKLLCLFVVR